MQLTLTNTDTIGNAESAEIDLVLRQVKFEWEPEMGQDDVMTQTVNWRAEYNTDYSYWSTFQLTNTQADYDA